MPNHITKITIPKNLNTNNLRVEIGMDMKELDEQVRILRDAMNHYGREHPEARGEEIYNVFEDAIVDHFNQVPHQNLVSTRDLTPDDPIQENRVKVICLRDGLYEWNEVIATSTRRVHVRNGGPFEYGIIYSFPIEDVRFEDEMGRWRI